MIYSTGKYSHVRILLFYKISFYFCIFISYNTNWGRNVTMTTVTSINVTTPS